MKLTTTRRHRPRTGPVRLTTATSTPGAMNPVLVTNTSSPISSAASTGRPARACSHRPPTAPRVREQVHPLPDRLRTRAERGERRVRAGRPPSGGCRPASWRTRRGIRSPLLRDRRTARPPGRRRRPGSTTCRGAPVAMPSITATVVGGAGGSWARSPGPPAGPRRRGAVRRCRAGVLIPSRFRRSRDSHVAGRCALQRRGRADARGRSPNSVPALGATATAGRCGTAWAADR